ncbi:hypothetical protein ABZ608_30980 [Streptomyces sp. NPDC013172]|uniref:hypothetical protein n=1 Tax=Streptomyces sp. NPDC013172 TaxID=3155009 RepID=UPI003400FB49
MVRTVTVVLNIVHVRESAPESLAQAPLVGPETRQRWRKQVPHEFAEGIRLRHPVST